MAAPSSRSSMRAPTRRRAARIASPSRSTPATIRSTVHWPERARRLRLAARASTPRCRPDCATASAPSPRATPSRRARWSSSLEEAPDASPRRRSHGRRAGGARPARRGRRHRRRMVGRGRRAPHRRRRHKRALLAAMGLPATSTGEARARLVEHRRRARAPRAAGDGRGARGLAGERRPRARRARARRQPRRASPAARGRDRARCCRSPVDDLPANAS